jgi:hypothetical protein
MLLSVFLPIFILAGTFFVNMIMDEPDLFWQNVTLLNGIPSVWFILFLITFTLSIGIWIFWSGRCLLPFFVTGTVYWGFWLLLCLGMGLDLSFGLKAYTPPEKRMIYWNNSTNIPAGTDVYCNGIYLGQIPLKIRVNELVDKVPEWTSPPEQYFYAENIVQIYTWFHWDDFRKERFLETKELLGLETKSETLSHTVRKKLSAKYDSGCRYWWRLENNKSQILVQKNFSSSYYLHNSFEKVHEYYINLNINTNNVFSPSAVIHAWLLAHVLAELTESEKNDWDKHVLKHWSLLSTLLPDDLLIESQKYDSKNPNDPCVKKFETALDSVARLKYGLSNPPTEEECRQLLANWVNQSIDNQQPFATSHIYSPLANIGFNDRSCITNGETPLIDAAIKLMGETVRKPLAEQWRTNYYRSDNGWAPLMYISEKDCGKEYFGDMVRYLATTYNGPVELLKNQNEQVIPLFRTLLYRKNILDLVKQDTNRYQQSIFGSIIFYGSIDNSLLDTTFHEYLIQVLSDPKLQRTNTDAEKLNTTIYRMLSERILRMNKEETDKEELKVRITSLPLKQTVKDSLLHIIHWENNKKENNIETNSSLTNILQRAVGNEAIIRTRKTIEDVNHWFAENPNGTLQQFFQTFENDFELELLKENNVQKKSEHNVLNLRPMFSGQEDFIGTKFYLPQYLVIALLEMNTPEIQKTIKQLCNNEVDREIVLTAISLKFLSENIRLGDIRMSPFEYMRFYTIEYLYFGIIDYPDYILDIFETLTEVERTEFISKLLLCPSPRAGQILEKWLQTEDKILNQKIDHVLKIRQKRKMIREETKKLFYELVEEKIIPDDLLVPQTPWVWQDGKYVHLNP